MLRSSAPRKYLDLYNGMPIPKPATFDDDLKGYPGKPKCFADAQNKIGTTSTSDAARSLEEMAKDYYAGLVGVDENIGRVMAHLEKKNILEDTAILHGSDHGYFMGEWRLFDKRLMHEPSIRVPLMVRYPKRIPAGTVREEMVLDTDIAPTFLDLAGVKVPEHMQGKSLLPLAKAHDPDVPQGVVLRILRVAEPGVGAALPRHSHGALQVHPLRHGPAGV